MAIKSGYTRDMLICLGSHRIRVSSSHDTILGSWAGLFPKWTRGEDEKSFDFSLALDFVPDLPPLPTARPIFADPKRILDVYSQPGGNFLLHFLDGGLVTIRAEPDASGVVGGQGLITSQLLRRGRLEDVTFTSLAPLLRRRGTFLVHAFGAARDGRAVLFVGPSGSGKTTTGLALMESGWKVLANDVVMVRRGPENEVIALPTPGNFGVRPETLDLLPSLRRFLRNSDLKEQACGKPVLLDIDRGYWANPGPVTALFFPEVASARDSYVAPQAKSLALAQLLEESADRWDEATLGDHSSLLQRLAEQSATYRLRLGGEIAQVLSLLEHL